MSILYTGATHNIIINAQAFLQSISLHGQIKHFQTLSNPLVGLPIGKLLSQELDVEMKSF